MKKFSFFNGQGSIFNVLFTLVLVFSLNFMTPSLYAADPTAGTIINIVQLTEATPGAGIPVASAATVYSHSIELPTQASFSIILTVTSSGTVDLQVDFEQSNVLPGTQGSSSANYVVPIDTAGDSVGLVGAIAAAGTYVINFAPVATGYGRLKITGGATNAATTKITKAEFYLVRG